MKDDMSSNTERFQPRLTPVAGRLAKKVALITGAASGIGRAIAVRFALEGAAIVLADINAEAAREAAGEVRRLGVEAEAIEVDVANRQSVESMAAQAAERMDGIDILVNNAGIIVFGSLMECRLEDWERMIAVDLTGAFHCTQVVGKVMVQQGRGGRMVHVGSTASLMPTALQAAYCVAKAGLRMLSQTAALELVKHGITSNLLCPEGAVTAINRDLLSDPAVMNQLESHIPAGRLSTVEEIAAAAAFLASEEAAYITGAELVHDGGVMISALWWR